MSSHLNELRLAFRGQSTLRKIYIISRATMRVIFIGLNHIYTLPTYLIWVVMFLPIRLIKPSLFWYLEGVLFKPMLAMITSWLWAAGYVIDESGDDITMCHDCECLVIVNHQSTADVPMMFNCLIAKDMVISNAMWLMDKQFMATVFGLVSLIRGDFFIQQGKQFRDSQLVLLQKQLERYYCSRNRKWFMLFPEGGFLRKRRANSQKYALKNNYPVLQNVTLPRIGAMKTILDTIGPKETVGDCENSQGKNDKALKWLIDITVAYPGAGRPLDLQTVMGGWRPPCPTTMYFRKYPISTVPFQDEDKLMEWMYKRFIEKEVILEQFYREGTFPSGVSPEGKGFGNSPIHTVKFSNLWYISLHIFWMLSTLFHYFLYRIIVSYC